MTTVYKYPLAVSDPPTDFYVPEGTRFVAVTPSDETPATLDVWGVADVARRAIDRWGEPEERRTLVAVGTGTHVDDAATYVGTVPAGADAWHVFEVTE